MDILDQGLDSSSQDKTNESTTSDEASSQIKIDDGAVGDGGDEQVAIANVANAGTASLIDPASGVQYQFRTENGQGGAVTYRVVQVAQGGGAEAHDGSAQVITTAFSGQQGVQAVIASPFSNGNSPTSDGQAGGEPRFAYYPTVAATAGDATSSEGQFYVMMSPQDVLTPGQRSIAPRTHQFSPKVEGGPRTARDERRRATHNEVERRRRDKINNWIIKLSKIVPECAQDHTKQGQVSKGGILAKACDYIQDLRTSNQRLAETMKDNERLSLDVELLRQQCEELKNDNAVLRAQLQQHGIVLADIASTS